MNLKKIKKRRITLIVILILIAACFGWIYWGNTSIQVTEISVGSKNIPESFHGFTIVQVSDLHNAEFGESQAGLLSAIKNAAPDLIAVTGDLIDSRHTDIETAMAFIDGAVQIAPVYYVTGNHEARIDEYAAFKERLEQAGAIILDDEAVKIQYGCESILLAGVNDPDFSSGDADDADVMAEKLEAILTEDSCDYMVLLSHRPELFDVYVDNNIDLVLSGHAHGGQIRLPFIGGVLAPDQGFFPQYVEGMYEEDQTKMVVSRGLGNSICPIRINNRPELVVITFE